MAKPPAGSSPTRSERPFSRWLGSGTPSSPVTLTYTDPNGNPATWIIRFTAQTVKTYFGCTNVGEYGPTSRNLVSEIDLPDQGTIPADKYTLTYESTPGYPGDVTARLASVTLPTGGTINYVYSGINNGISCNDGALGGAIPVLTRQTPDGTWTYTRVDTSPWTTITTTIADPLANQTVVTFMRAQNSEDGYETQRKIYNGSSTLLQTISTCYDGTVAAPCGQMQYGLPLVSQKSIFSQWSNGQESEQNTIYDTPFMSGTGTSNYGRVAEVDEYDFGNGAPGSLLRKTTTSYASLSENIVNDGAVTGPIADRPSQVSVYDGSNNLKAQTTYTYDGATPVSAGITTQHVSMTGSRGNPTTITRLVSGSSTASVILLTSTPAR